MEPASSWLLVIGLVSAAPQRELLSSFYCNKNAWNSHCRSAVINQTRIYEDVGLIPGLC